MSKGKDNKGGGKERRDLNQKGKKIGLESERMRKRQEI